MTSPKRALLVAAGPDFPEQRIAGLLAAYPFIIAVDGGASKLAVRSIRPDLLIGDFDSLDHGALEKYERDGVEIVRFPSAKDQTDLELALAESIHRGIQDVALIGVHGGEPDHALANIHLLARDAPHFQSLRVIDSRGEGQFLVGPATVNATVETGRSFSIIPLTPKVRGVTVRGCRWPLTDATLSFGSTYSLRNEGASDSINLTFVKGTVLLWVLGGPLRGEQ